MTPALSRWLFVLCLGVAGCDCGDEGTASGEPSEPAVPPAEPGVDLRSQLLVDVDRRVLSDALREAASSTDVALRGSAMLGVARLHDPGAVPILLDGLRDPDAAVRRHASLGLGAFEDEAEEGIKAALLGALAAEADRETRAAFLTDLGRVGGDEALPAFREALAGNEPEVRAAACTGLGSYGLRSRVLDPALMRRLAARMVDDTTPEVRLACSYALTRLAPPVDAPAEARGIIEDITRAAADEEPEVRAMAVRALGRYPAPPVDLLVARTQDADWRVAVQAFRSLARVPQSAAPYARALAARVDRALGVELAGPELHVLLAALEAAAPLAREAPIPPVAVSALERLAEGGAPAADRDRGLAHCAAAGLVDRGRGWPTRTTECGLGKVDEEERRVMMAAVLADLEGAAPERVTLIERLFREGGPRAQQAALAAAPSLDPVAIAPTVLAGLRSADPGVITAASDAVIALAPKWRAPPADTAPVLSVRPAGEAAPPQASPPTGPSTRQLTRALRAAGDRLRRGDEVEGLQSWARAVAAVEARGLAEPLGELVRHPIEPVRSAATEALRALGAQAPEGERRPVDNPIDPASVPGPDEAVRAVISTDRGEIELLLETAHAPTTVARFRELARADFYDGLTFHRVVPAFVVQGGDPRGDGYGGPGWTQRCEDNRVPYRRGTVGMALAGRDTGGSQLFIAHSAQPHLENRYTAFARVIRGMEVVDALQVGDRIRDVRISEDDS